MARFVREYDLNGVAVCEFRTAHNNTVPFSFRVSAEIDFDIHRLTASRRRLRLLGAVACGLPLNNLARLMLKCERYCRSTAEQFRPDPSRQAARDCVLPLRSPNAQASGLESSWLDAQTGADRIAVEE